MTSPPQRLAGLLVLALAFALALAGGGPFAAGALASGLADDGGAEWRLEKVVPPALPSGLQSTMAIGLGRIGDIEFWAPNRGLLVTAGNGEAIPPGLWAYNGVSWHELATVCGATDGRIAWAGPEEFWTISDGRPGQASGANGQIPPLQDNTLCHFSGGAVVTSYAAPAFQASSYRPMHAAGCLSATDCWFAGDALLEPQVGAFHLHWTGGGLEATPYEGEGHAVQDMRAFDGQLYESVRLSPGDAVLEHTSQPPILHTINPSGISPTFEALSGVPLYAPGEFPGALDFLHLGADANALWAVADPQPEVPTGSQPGQLVIVRYAPPLGWSQLLGPGAPPAGEALPAEAVVSSIAAEPGAEAAWLALDTQTDAANPSPTARAVVARISAQGVVSDEQTLPTSQEVSEGVSPKGAAARITCPAAQDCWLTTTQGWLFHLTNLPPGTPPPEGLDSDSAFAGPITFRPSDEGLPQVLPDAPPPDDSGLVERPPSIEQLQAEATVSSKTTVTAPLLSHIHTRLVHGSTLELRFHLAAQARVRLLAKRRKRVVAATPNRALPAGNRTLLLRLDPHRWPTKLDLQTHALAPLPKISLTGAGGASDTVGTGLFTLPRTPAFSGSGPLE